MSGYYRWMAALLSLAILCTAMSGVSIAAAGSHDLCGCPESCGCGQCGTGHCPCHAGTSPAYGGMPIIPTPVMRPTVPTLAPGTQLPGNGTQMPLPAVTFVPTQSLRP